MVGLLLFMRQNIEMKQVNYCQIVFYCKLNQNRKQIQKTSLKKRRLNYFFHNHSFLIVDDLIVVLSGLFYFRCPLTETIVGDIISFTLVGGTQIAEENESVG